MLSVIILLAIVALGSVIWLVAARARRLRKLRSESVAPTSAGQPIDIGTSVSSKDKSRQRLEPEPESSRVPLPDTDTSKEKASESTTKPAENPCVVVPSVPAPVPCPAEPADSMQTEKGCGQPLQPGGSEEGRAETNVPQQTAQPEEREAPASTVSRGPFEETLTTSPHEPKAPATQPASAPGDTVEASGEPEKEDVVPGRLTYRPPSINPPRGRPGTRTQPRSVQREQPRGQLLEVNIQAIFDRHGFCQIRLLGERPSDGAQEVEVRSGRETFVLSAYGDAWYEIAAGEKLATLLGDGFRFSTREPVDAQSTWRLSGRDVYVLAGRHGLAGSVSTTWLKIGRDDQVVLCKAGRAAEVMAVLGQAGCVQLEAHSEDYGAPAGWIFFRGVKPLRTLPHASGNDILDVLRPLPEVEIELDDGLWLYDSVWLAGFPPKISVSGDIPSHTEVRIDNHPAALQENGSFTAPGWDQDGDHIVWCGGTQAKYSISSPSPDWEPWQPYDYAGGMVCGAIAIPQKADQLATVPITNRVLLGAKPGEVFRCGMRAGTEWTGFVPFKVVWAIPDDALHSDRNNHRVLLFAAVPPDLLAGAEKFHRGEKLAVWLWCQAILDCRRKGLPISPVQSEADQLWRDYARLARKTWRTLKQHGTK